MDSLLDFDKDFTRPPWGPYGRDFTLGVVSGISKFVLQVLNKTHVSNIQTYLDLIHNRSTGVGLLTVCNHTSTFDDPGLPCAMLPWSFFWTEHTHGKNRWTMCASDICFTNELLRQFFLNGKTLPIERGSGVAQASMGVAARTLAAGDWLHIFPEGRVTPDGTVGPFRQGIGKLICDARAVAGGRDPVILPFFHSGMARVMPFKHTLPGVGHSVEVAVGQPLDLGHITCRCNKQGEDQQQVWRDIAAALRDAVLQLEQRVPPNPNQVAERPDVARWEANYQAKRGQRQEEQQADLAFVSQQQEPESFLDRQPAASILPAVMHEITPVQEALHQDQRRQRQLDSAESVAEVKLLSAEQQQQQQQQQRDNSQAAGNAWWIWSSLVGRTAHKSAQH